MTANADNVRDFVRAYILNEFLSGVNPSEFTDATPLISGGILDSLATVKLVAELEERFGIEIHAHEASVNHLNSVAEITSLVEGKLKA